MLKGFFNIQDSFVRSEMWHKIFALWIYWISRPGLLQCESKRHRVEAGCRDSIFNIICNMKNQMAYGTFHLVKNKKQNIEFVPCTSNMSSSNSSLLLLTQNPKMKKLIWITFSNEMTFLLLQTFKSNKYAYISFRPSATD